MNTTKALVVCIGNELVGDDAVGHAVFQALSDGPLPANARVEYVGLGGINLLDLLEPTVESLVVVDAVWLGSPVGTVHQLAWDDLPSSIGTATSAHGIGLRDALEIGAALRGNEMPSRVALVGVEGRRFTELGEAMSPEVANAVRTAVARVLELVGGEVGAKR